jgi:AraC-like DNA-binding protein
MRAAMLMCTPANRIANRLLAALIAVLALYTGPYILGFAGYYDAYPWLSFAPYNLSLAVGPLVYLYLGAMSGVPGTGQRRRLLHLLPALLQLLYYSCLFAQPLAVKNSWDKDVHRPYVGPGETLLLMGSLLAYAILAWRRYRECDAMAKEWARNMLVAVGLTVAFWLALTVAEFAWSGLSYFQRFPFYVWLAILIAYLGTEGYRQGAVSLPAPAPAAAPPPSPVPGATETMSLAALGAGWRASITAERGWRDPELTVATLARRLGTNTTTLSRALNDGLGVSFTEMINRMRVDAVIVALSQHHDKPVLDIAMAEGFNSKASFNRAFKLYTGSTPTAYRRQGPLETQVSTSG